MSQENLLRSWKDDDAPRTATHPAGDIALDHLSGGRLDFPPGFTNLLWSLFCCDTFERGGGCSIIVACEPKPRPPDPT